MALNITTPQHHKTANIQQVISATKDKSETTSIHDDQELQNNKLINNISNNKFEWSLDIPILNDDNNEIYPRKRKSRFIPNNPFKKKFGRKITQLKGQYSKVCDLDATYLYNFTSVSSIISGDKKNIFSGVNAQVYISCIAEHDGDFVYDLQARKIKRFQKGPDGDEKVIVQEDDKPSRFIQNVKGKIKKLFLSESKRKHGELLKKAITESYQTILDFNSNQHNTSHVLEGTLGRRIERFSSIVDEKTGNIHIESEFNKKDIDLLGEEVDIEDLTSYKQIHRLVLNENLVVLKSEIRSESLLENEDEPIAQESDGSELKIIGGVDLFLVKRIVRKKSGFNILSKSKNKLNSRDNIFNGSSEHLLLHEDYNIYVKPEILLDERDSKIVIPGQYADSNDFYEGLKEHTLIADMEIRNLDSDEIHSSFNNIINDPKNTTNIQKFVPLMKRDKKHTISTYLIKKAKKHKGALRKAIVQILGFSSNPEAHLYLLDLISTGDKTASIMIHFIRKPQESLFIKTKDLPIEVGAIILGSVLRKQSDEIITKYYLEYLEILKDKLIPEDIKDSILDGLKNLRKKKNVFLDYIKSNMNKFDSVVQDRVIELYNIKDEDLLNHNKIFERDHVFNDWTNNTWLHRGVGSLRSRKLDSSLYPHSKSYIGSKKVGFNSFNAQFTASTFAGNEGKGCFGGNSKVMGRLSAIGNFWGKSHRLLAVEAKYNKVTPAGLHQPAFHGVFLPSIKLEIGKYTVFKLVLPIVCDLIRYEVLESTLVPGPHFKAYYPVGGAFLEAGAEFGVEVALITEFEHCADADSMRLSIFGEIGPTAAGVAGLSVGIMDTGLEFLAAFWVQLGPSITVGPANAFLDEDNNDLGRIMKRDIPIIPLNITTSNTNIANSNTNIINSNINITSSDTNITSSNINITSSDTNITSSNINITSSDTNNTSSNTNITNSNTNITNSNTNITNSNITTTGEANLDIDEGDDLYNDNGDFFLSKYFHKALDTPIEKITSGLVFFYRKASTILKENIKIDFKDFRKLINHSHLFGPPENHYLFNSTTGRPVEHNINTTCTACFGLSYGILPSLLRFSYFIRILETVPIYRAVIWYGNPIIIRPYVPIKQLEKCFSVKDKLKVNFRKAKNNTTISDFPATNSSIELDVISIASSENNEIVILSDDETSGNKTESKNLSKEV